MPFSAIPGNKYAQPGKVELGKVGQNAYAQTLSGALSFTGAVARGTAKGLTAAGLSFTGALATGANRFLALAAAALSFAGSVASQLVHPKPGRVITGDYLRAQAIVGDARRTGSNPAEYAPQANIGAESAEGRSLGGDIQQTQAIGGD